MNKTLLVIVALLLGGWTWHWLALSADERPSREAKAVASVRPSVPMSPTASATRVAGPGLSFAHAPSQATGQTPRGVSGAAVGVTASATLPVSGHDVRQLGLTRQLAGEHRLTLDGRARAVLGSKEVVGRDGVAETMLVLRDEASGQITYYRSGLLFTLNEGADYEAFIAEHPRLRRLFVNPQHAQVAVDAADIAAEFNALRADPRVASLRFMTREAVRVPK